MSSNAKSSKRAAEAVDDMEMSPELIKQLKAEKKERETQRKTNEAYGKSLWSEGMRNGGIVKMTPKSTPYRCGGKVK